MRLTYCVLIVAVAVCAMAAESRTKTAPKASAKSAVKGPAKTVAKPGDTATSKGSSLMEMVDVSQIAPSIVIDIKWATTDDNMLHRKIYAENRCFLRRETGDKLARVQQRLKKQGLGLKIWEGYRPMWMQRLMFAEIQDGDLVSDPNGGHCSHTRGIAVDVTLMDSSGDELQMPTAYCEFAKREQIKQDYMKLPAPVLKNRETLKNAMSAEGFLPYKNEWWHFTLPHSANYPILDENQLVKPLNPLDAKPKTNGNKKPPSIGSACQ